MVKPETDLAAQASTQLILYACPLGALAQQIDTYLQQAAADCGLNSAHQYMPHCTLTGFFEDYPPAVSIYAERLDQLLAERTPHRPDPVVTITGISFQPTWHGLELEAPWLHQLALAFRDRAESVTRLSPIRPKTWLHLSLAYGFTPEQASHLRHLAQIHINPASPVNWELRLYERRPGNGWICHRSWPLGQSVTSTGWQN